MAGNKTAVALDAATAANLVSSGHWIDYGFGLSQPDAFDAALARRGPELADVKIRSALTLSPRNDRVVSINNTVTEFGMVNLKGRSVAERAKAMISIAHPDYRESLAREARAHGVFPRGYG